MGSNTSFRVRTPVTLVIMILSVKKMWSVIRIKQPPLLWSIWFIVKMMWTLRTKVTLFFAGQINLVIWTDVWATGKIVKRYFDKKKIVLWRFPKHNPSNTAQRNGTEYISFSWIISILQPQSILPWRLKGADGILSNIPVCMQ